MDEDPMNVGLKASGLEGSQMDEDEVMEIDDLPPPPRDWHDEYLAWLDRGELPPERTEVRRISRKAKSFVVINGELYKCGASGIMHHCISISEGRELTGTFTRANAVTTPLRVPS
jgi:hypothetical protein